MSKKCRVCKTRLAVTRGLCVACYDYCRRMGLITIKPKPRRDKEAVRKALGQDEG